MPRVCSVTGCDRPHKARDLCLPHYARFERTGDVRVDEPIRAFRGYTPGKIRAYKRWLSDAVCSGPCTDCGHTFHPCQMDLDHVMGEKVESVSRMTMGKWTIDEMVLEINKCKIVCANCHRLRTKFNKRTHNSWA